MRWSQKQTPNNNMFKQMMNNGVRYFDIEVVYKNGKFYTTHGLDGYEVSKGLNEVSNFLKLNPKECVILSFDGFYNFDEKVHTQFIKFLDGFERSGKLKPMPSQAKMPTLDDFEKLNSSAIIICNYTKNRHVKLWKASDHQRAMKITNAKSCEIVKDIVEFNYVYEDAKFNVAYATRNPTYCTVLFNLFSSFENVIAKPINSYIMPWLQMKYKYKKTDVNVLCCDFVDTKGLADAIVKLNENLFVGST